MGSTGLECRLLRWVDLEVLENEGCWKSESKALLRPSGEGLYRNMRKRSFWRFSKKCEKGIRAMRPGIRDYEGQLNEGL